MKLVTLLFVITASLFAIDTAPAQETVETCFCHSFEFDEPVLAVIASPHGSVSLVVDKDQTCPGILFFDDGKRRTVSAFKMSNGELVFFESFKPGPFCVAMAQYDGAPKGRAGKITKSKPAETARQKVKTL